MLLFRKRGKENDEPWSGSEVAVHRNRVFVTGRIACEGAGDIDVAGLVRDVYRTAGYGDGW